MIAYLAISKPLRQIVRTHLSLALLAMILFTPQVARSQITVPAPIQPAAARVSSAFATTPSPLLEAADPPENARDLTNINPLRIFAAAGDALTGSKNATPTSGRGAGTGGGGGSTGGGLSASINILVVLTVVSLAPSIMLMSTCFVRIIVVLGLLKQALGTQSLPPPQVIVGLALFMTMLVMSPTFDRIHKDAIVPYSTGQIRDYDELWSRAKQPVREFMFDQIEATGNWSSVYMVLNYRGIDTSNPGKLTTADVDMISLIPAFMLSELKAGFLIGFKVYLPFLVIDMVISSLLISMGMVSLPPVLISLPFKLLLFVLVDGWQLVVGSLMQSFVTHPLPPPPSPAVTWLPGLMEHAGSLLALSRAHQGLSLG